MAKPTFDPSPFEILHGDSSNQIAKAIIGTNNPSHEDQFPKMSSWPCHPPLMAINGNYISSLIYLKPWHDIGHQRFPSIKTWHICLNVCTCWLGNNPHTCTTSSYCQKYPSWLASLWLRHNHLSTIPLSLHPTTLLSKLGPRPFPSHSTYKVI